jgi:hypothetical protein
VEDPVEAVLDQLLAVQEHRGKAMQVVLVVQVMVQVVEAVLLL